MATRWDAFTDGELVFMAEAIEISDWEAGLVGRQWLDLWESLLDALDSRPVTFDTSDDRRDIERQRNPPPPSAAPAAPSEPLTGPRVSIHLIPR
jgi:hypothetical protein